MFPGHKSAFAGSSAILALTIPVAAILGACFYVCYSILRSSAHQADAAQLEAEQRIARAAILFTTAPIIKSNGDYAYWDELFLRSKNPLDAKWADAHLGSYQQNLTGITGSAVLTKTGALQYLYLSPRSGLSNLTPQELRFSHDANARRARRKRRKSSRPAQRVRQVARAPDFSQHRAHQGLGTGRRPQRGKAFRRR